MQPVQTESSRDLNKALHCSILFAYEIGLYQRMQISDQFQPPIQCELVKMLFVVFCGIYM